jgi:hypothetical protein
MSAKNEFANDIKAELQYITEYFRAQPIALQIMWGQITAERDRQKLAGKGSRILDLARITLGSIALELTEDQSVVFADDANPWQGDQGGSSTF